MSAWCLRCWDTTCWSWLFDLTTRESLSTMSSSSSDRWVSCSRNAKLIIREISQLLHHQTGESVGQGISGSSTRKWVSYYWNNKLIIRQVSCYRSDQSGRDIKIIKQVNCYMNVKFVLKQAIFVTGMSVVRWVSCYRNVSVLLQECQCVVTETSSSSSYRWVSCYRNVRQLMHGGVLQTAISLIWINSH